MPGPRFFDRRRAEDKEVFSVENWTPKTRLGEMVKNKEITAIEQIFSSGKVIKEVEIVDALLPNLEDNVLEIASVQRMTKNNRKQKYRVTAVIGDRNGHVGIGVGKDVEVKPAIETAIRDAKKHIISIDLGCGSSECNCGTRHSLPLTLTAKCGSAQVILKPAPKGVGIIAGATVKSVLELSGVKDIWTFARGRTRDKYNAGLATYNALKSLSEIKNVEMLTSRQQNK